MGTILPIRHQAPLPEDRLIITEPPGEEAMDVDVLIVGGGPAGLSAAIELARLARNDDALGELTIGVLEKAGSLGEHNLSGAVVNPRAFQELFPGHGIETTILSGRGDQGSGLLPDREAARSDPDPADHAQQGVLLGSICEDRALAGRAGRGTGGRRLRRLPGGRHCSLRTTG